MVLGSSQCLRDCQTWNRVRYSNEKDLTVFRRRRYNLREVIAGLQWMVVLVFHTGYNHETSRTKNTALEYLLLVY